MRTPSHITSAEFSDSLKEFFECRCLLLGNTLLCRECGASIVHARVVISIHDSAFHDKCAACGKRAWTMTLPYCPQCEKKPEERGCLHLSFSDLPKAA
jgi:ribosomal protein L37E